MKKVDAIIFDFDNTLYPEKVYFENVLTLFCKKIKAPKSLYKKILDVFEEIRPTSKNIFKDLLEPFNLHNSENSDLLFYCYLHVRKKITLYPDAYEILDHLKTKNIKLGLLTNGLLAAQQNKVKLANVTPYFNEVVFARMFGKDFEKPHIKTFDYITKKLGVKSENCIFIGDNLRTDFEAPYSMNATTVYINRDSNNIKNNFVDFSIQNLNELKDLI